MLVPLFSYGRSVTPVLALIVCLAAAGCPGDSGGSFNRPPPGRADTLQGGTAGDAGDNGESVDIPAEDTQGNSCIRVWPPTIDFGAVLVGKPATREVKIESCGEGDLEITGIELGEEGGSSFMLDTTSFAVDSEDTAWPSPSAPKTVPAGASARFRVVYSPEAESPEDTSGRATRDKTKILVHSNAAEGTVEVNAMGLGTTTPCPTAVITLTEGAEEVVPQTTLVLSAEDSIPTQGTISQYRWKVTQPRGAASVFHPSATAPRVQFELNVAGSYVFALEVKDAVDWSCVPAVREVAVIPDEAIHIELTWETHNDPDPTDEGIGAGTDMDLHFVHLENALASPQAEDLYPPGAGDGTPEGYFDALWDIFWFYVTHDWGQLGFDGDDPSLDRDDVDGAGPENLNLNGPEEGATYKIGVHYFDDHEYGPSVPCVEVFIFGVAVMPRRCGCRMSKKDMWEVGTITWPTEQVEAPACSGKAPPPAGSPWPARPCGGAGNRSEDGGPCTSVILPAYESERFAFE